MTDTKIINSKEDARVFWEEEFGLPEYFSSYDEVADAEMMLEELRVEKDKLNREIQNRDVNYINEYTINRSIELHFLVETGTKYCEDCLKIAEHSERENARHYEEVDDIATERWDDDDLFRREYED